MVKNWSEGILCRKISPASVYVMIHFSLGQSADLKPLPSQCEMTSLAIAHLNKHLGIFKSFSLQSFLLFINLQHAELVSDVKL